MPRAHTMYQAVPHMASSQEVKGKLSNFTYNVDHRMCMQNTCSEQEMHVSSPQEGKGKLSKLARSIASKAPLVRKRGGGSGAQPHLARCALLLRRGIRCHSTIVLPYVIVPCGAVQRLRAGAVYATRVSRNACGMRHGYEVPLGIAACRGTVSECTV